MNVRVDLSTPIYDGMEVIFKSPCNASDVTGLNVYYPQNGVQELRNFAFADAHANDVGHLDALFAAGAVVKVILDLDTNMAFIQNAATNAYLEDRFSNLGGSPGIHIGPEPPTDPNVNLWIDTDEDADAHINSLIDAKLGVIENGSY